MNRETQGTLLRLAAWGLCAVPVVLAMGRSDHAPRPAAPAKVNEVNGDGGVFEHTRGDHPFQRIKVTDEDWKQAEEFLRQHSPRRFKQLETFAAGEPRESVKRFLVNRWRSVMMLQKESADLYATKVREVEVEDDVFGLCRDLKSGDGDKRRLHAQLHDAIAKLFDLGLTERRLRIDLAEKAVDWQKKILDADLTRKDQLIEERFHVVSTQGVEGAPLGVGRYGKHKGVSEGSTTSPGDAP